MALDCPFAASSGFVLPTFELHGSGALRQPPNTPSSSGRLRKYALPDGEQEMKNLLSPSFWSRLFSLRAIETAMTPSLHSVESLGVRDGCQHVRDVSLLSKVRTAMPGRRFCA
jgi:hypothetical protein